MRVPWFHWRISERSDDVVSWSVCAPRERSEDEVSLALRLIPLYHVFLRAERRRDSAAAWRPTEWRVTLTPMLGVERAQRVLSELRASGIAIIATCPRELAEHYREELARQALPCEIAPA